MKVGVQGRNRLQAGGQKFGLDEFDSLNSALSGWTNRQHNDDGAHTDVTADKVTISAVRDAALKVVSGRADIGAGFALSGTITPPILLTDAINYSPPGIDGAFCIRASCDALCSITGIQDGPRMTPVSGRLLLFLNVGSNTFVLRHEELSSFAEFRFRLPGLGDVLLPPNTACLLYYDATSRRWTILANSTGVGTINDAEYNAGDSGAAIELDWANGTQQIVTLTDDAAVTLVGPAEGQEYRIIFVQGTPGGRIPTFEPNVIIENSPNATDLVDGAVFLLTLVYTAEGGGTYLGYYAPADASGFGDVFGPASSVDDRIATFDGTDGKHIQDSGMTIADVIAAASGGSGAVVQVVNVLDGVRTTGTTILPLDATIPQNTEGDEYMSLTVTPTDVANELVIDVLAHFAANNNTIFVSFALFQDSVANALNAGTVFLATGGGTTPVTLRHKMVAGTTSATTFKLRAGPHSATTVYFNGDASIQYFGGVYYSSITITEIVP